MNTRNESREEQAGELEKPLGPEYVSFKNGHAYIEGHKVVKLANEVFGFDGWSSEVRSMTIDYEDENSGRYTIGVSCTMRITLKAGVYREDIGYGSSINMPHKYQAYDKARKEAATDALKRALRQFGESLGNCLYNKEYVNMVRRLKPEKSTFDVEDLRRPKKRQRNDIEVVLDTKSLAAPAKSPEALAMPVRQQNPPAFMFDDDDENDFDSLPGPLNATVDQQKYKCPAITLSANEDAVFVTADHADLIRSPSNQSTPLPSDALFDVSRGSLKNSSVPQDRSMRIPRRPKT